MTKQPYDLVKLRLTSWHCEDRPVPGDEFVTGSGRRYQVIRIAGKTHHCLVLPADAEVQGKRFGLTWNKR